MKMFLLFAVSLISQWANAGEPILKSVEEKIQYTDITFITYEWMLPADVGHPLERTFFVQVTQVRDLKGCSATLFREAERQGDTERRKWHSAPRMSRAEFVEILVKSELELKRTKSDCFFDYIYVQYQTIEEHEAELSSLIKRIFADEKGPFSPGNKTVTQKIRKSFAASKSVALTRKKLKEQGLDFSASSLDEFHPMVDRKLATSWQAAAELADFSLSTPPRVEINTRANKPGAGQPASRPESKSEGRDKPQPESEGRTR